MYDAFHAFLSCDNCFSDHVRGGSLTALLAVPTIGPSFATVKYPQCEAMLASERLAASAEIAVRTRLTTRFVGAVRS
jgi:hypothetical protein